MWVRIITGVVIAIVVLAAVFGFNDHYFAIFCGLIISWAAVEWMQFAHAKNWIWRFPYLIVLWALMFAAWHAPVLTAVIGTIWWVCAIVMLWVPTTSLDFVKSKAFLIPAGYLTLVPAWMSLVSIHHMHVLYHLDIIFIIAVIALSDTGAYFSGSKFGKTKLAPYLSPKKTYEGLVGGLILSVIAGLIIACFSQHPHDAIFFIEIAAMTVLLVVLGVFGDLFESLIKRQTGIKDSGSLLPGHGGVLDRVDSLCAALPVFLLLQVFLGLIA